MDSCTVGTSDFPLVIFFALELAGDWACAGTVKDNIHKLLATIRLWINRIQKLPDSSIIFIHHYSQQTRQLGSTYSIKHIRSNMFSQICSAKYAQLSIINCRLRQALDVW